MVCYIVCFVRKYFALIENNFGPHDRQSTNIFWEAAVYKSYLRTKSYSLIPKLNNHTTYKIEKRTPKTTS